MRHTAGEVPQVALLQIVDEVAALVVKRRNAHLSVEHVRPLGLLVPMQFANDALAQAHVDASQLARGGQLTDCGLAGPAAFLDLGENCVSVGNGGVLRAECWGASYLNPHVRIGKTPAHVRHIAVVGAGRPDEIRVLARPARVPRAQDGGAQAIAIWQGVEVIFLRVDGAVVGVAEVWAIGVLDTSCFGAGLELVRNVEAGGETLLGRVAVGCGEGQAREGRCQEDLRDEHGLG